MILDVEATVMIDVALKCTACRNKSSFCSCDEPSLVSDVFALLLAKQDSTPVYVMVKDFDLLCSILDVTPAEVDISLDYIRRFGEFKTVNETLKSKSFELKRVFSFFNKIPSKKAIYGQFAAKKDKVKGLEDNIVPDHMRGEGQRQDASNFLFANGTVKLANRGQQVADAADDSRPHYVLTYHLVAQYCERVPPLATANLNFKSIFSHLS